MKDLVSIIVPIYKVEKDLERCVNSIINQTYKNLEIILIDDGSPDKCGLIADQFAELDSRIEVIHKENGGLSDARNVGIELARGDYLTFIDSDDAVDLNYIETMLNLLVHNDSQVAICNHSFFSEDGRVWNENLNKVETFLCNGLQAAKIILYQKKYDVSAWGKLYKTETFNELRFPKGYIFEDIPTTYKALMRSKRVIFTTETLYKYQIRANSIENEKFSMKKLDGIYTGNLLLKDVENDYKELLKAAKSRYIAINFHILAQIDCDIPERYHIQENIKQVRKEVMLDSSANFRVRGACLLSYLSFDLPIWLLNRRQ